MECFIAVDIGASSGRHIAGWLEKGRICTKEVYRFQNGAEERDGHLRWDIPALGEHLFSGLRAAAKAGFTVTGVGIDTWGVDYVLLDNACALCGGGYAYRDRRTEGGRESLRAAVSDEELYSRTGIQYQPFNTVYQLRAEQQLNPAALSRAAHFLMIPDYLNFLLCGKTVNEYTNASTTSLLGVGTRGWDAEIISRAGLPARLFDRPPVMPGTRLGRLTPAARKSAGCDCEVYAVASHDTGSAYMAFPAENENAVYLSSGTWSLLGTPLNKPVLTPEARKAGFTNEGGYGGTVRFLKNIMGLWMLQSLRREEKEDDPAAPARWALRSRFDGIVDVNDASFLAPPSMSAAVKDWFISRGEAAPQGREDISRCIYRSLAACYRDAVKQLGKITGRRFDAINIVGGGSRDALLCSLTARECGLPVCAGPAEGTAMGNLMAQLIAAGKITDLTEAKKILRESVEITEYKGEEYAKI